MHNIHLPLFCTANEEMNKYVKLSKSMELEEWNLVDFMVETIMNTLVLVSWRCLKHFWCTTFFTVGSPYLIEFSILNTMVQLGYKYLRYWWNAIHFLPTAITFIRLQSNFYIATIQDEELNWSLWTGGNYTQGHFSVLNTWLQSSGLFTIARLHYEQVVTVHREISV